MLKVVTNNRLLFIGIHVVIGFLAASSTFSKLFGAFIITVGLVIVVLSSNKKEEALLISSYIVGLEVFLRMTKGTISYEMGKYGVALFLIVGMLVGETKQKLSVAYFLYILLLLLGIVFTQVPEGESIRKAITFNLSGPIVLGICALYLYKRPIEFSELKQILFFLLLPIFSMVSYMYFRTPNLREMVFGTGSNFDTSGGFGPNQVSTILGLGMFVLAVFLYMKIKVTGFIILDALFLAYFTYRGLLTFSRGGVLTAGVGSIKLIIKYLFISSFFIFGIWLYTSNITGGMIDNRYAGKDRTGKKKDVSSGRLGVFTSQLESFKEAPLFGIGVGNGKYKREKKGELITTSHNEVSRIIEEHGLIGVILLIILIYIPMVHFKNANNFQRGFILSFFVFWFLTVNHSAMRIGFPGFIYALSLIHIRDTEIKE